MKKVRVALAAVLAAAITVTASYAAALSVTRYTQEKTNWCWAACDQMVLKYETGTKVSQSDIVKTIYEDAGNYTADMKAQIKVLKEFGNPDLSDVDYWTVDYEKWIRPNFEDGHPTIVAFVNSSTGLGHSLVMTNAPSEGDTTLIDPWASTSNPKIYYTWEELEEGIYLPAIGSSSTPSACIVY